MSDERPVVLKQQPKQNKKLPSDAQLYVCIRFVIVIIYSDRYRQVYDLQNMELKLNSCVCWYHCSVYCLCRSDTVSLSISLVCFALSQMATSDSSVEGSSVACRHPTKVLVVGHSYIKRLRQFMREGSAAKDLGLQNVDVRLSGVGGAVVRPGRSEKCLLSIVSTCIVPSPDIVFIHIGENDVLDDVLRPDDISAGIIAIVDYITAICHPTVIVVSELLPFPKLADRLAETVMRINASLSSAAALRNNRAADAVSDSVGHPVTEVKVWKHTFGIWRNPAKYFEDDRVHLTPQGMQCYWHSVRACLGHCVARRPTQS